MKQVTIVKTKEENMKNFKEKEFYKEKIIEMVEEIDNQELLIKIFTFIKTWLE